MWCKAFTNEKHARKLFSFILLANVMVTPIQMLTAFSVRFPNDMAGFKNFAEIMDTEPEIKDMPAAVEVCSLRGDIKYENLTLGCNEGQAVLENIKLSIGAGKNVGFAGTSGGKTTLCSLLPRSYSFSLAILSSSSEK